MYKFRNGLKGGLVCGLALALMLSGTSCGKEKIVVEDYGGETVTDSSETETKSDMVEGHSLTEMFGSTISESDTFTIGGINGIFKLNYSVPEADQVNVYEGKFIENSSEIENQIVDNFFGGTEKKLEEIRYENDVDYIPLLYKYRFILMIQDIGGMDAVITQDVFDQYFQNIDSSFSDVYTWVDEDDYYIHMYEGEYNGNRFGMIYSYDKVYSIRNIYICPINVKDYMPEIDAKTMYVVDSKSDYDTENPCGMTEAGIMTEAGDLLEKLGFDKKDVQLTFNPNMAVMDGWTYDYSEIGLDYTEMPKLVFADTGMESFVQKNGTINPTGYLYSYKILQGMEPERPGYTAEEVNITENGYAVYLCSTPFSGNVMPQEKSVFNRGNIYYTDKGLYTVDISQVVGIDNVVDDVRLLSFSNVKECFKEALQNDLAIAGKASGSVDVTDVDFTYVLIEDEASSSKATYVPAWVFTTQDNNLKSGEIPIFYTTVINAIDGSDLRDVII